MQRGNGLNFKGMEKYMLETELGSQFVVDMNNVEVKFDPCMGIVDRVLVSRLLTKCDIDFYMSGDSLAGSSDNLHKDLNKAFTITLI